MTNREMNELISKLNYATKMYDAGAPVLTDKEWDDMFFELVKAEEENGVMYKDSPTQKVIWEDVSQLNKVKHNHPMLSLAKTKEISEILKFIGDKQVLAMNKMDGLTCSLRYMGGRLVSAETRGDGTEGEDILHNAKIISNIPMYISYKDELVVDGEIICDLETFNLIKDIDNYKHPRNLAAGAIRRLSASECAKASLSFVAWDVIKGFDECKLLSEKLNRLEQYKFDVVPALELHDNSNEEEINRAITVLKISAATYAYPIDGLVFKYDDIDYYHSLGNTDHHFRGGIAYKFYDDEYETNLIDIEWSMSRTGTLTPVAIFETIEIDGTDVSRASLSNVSVMRETLGKYPYKGQIVYVSKRNQIIPKIERAVKNDISGENVIESPSVCPCCGGNVVFTTSVDGTETLKCDNEACSGKLINVIDHFCSKDKGLDIRGLSKATIEKLIEFGWITKRTDIFELHEFKKDWEKLPGFGPKSVSNILGAIETAKSTNFESYLSSLGIPLIGRRVSKELGKKFKSYDEFRNAIRNGFDFSSFSGFGYEMSKAIMNYDYAEADYIAEHYLTFAEPQQATIPTNSAAAALNVVITGKLSRKRDDIIADVEAAGGKVSSSVSSKTTHLVCNQPENTSKYRKAQELNIPIISEQELMNMLG